MWFHDLSRWDAAGFRQARWLWPDAVLQPLGAVVRRVVDEVAPDAARAELPIIEKISFGGELSLSSEAGRADYKGRLFWAKTGQLTYSKIRVKQGSFCVISADLPTVAVSAEYPVYEIETQRISPVFLGLLLRSGYMKGVLDGLAHGSSTKTRIHPEQFEALQIPVPPMDVQHAIVTQWEQAQAEVQRAEALATEREAQAQAGFLAALGLSASVQPQDKRRAFALNFSAMERWGVGVNQPGDKFDVTQGIYPVIALGDVIADLSNGWSPQCLNRPVQGDEWGVLKLGAVSFGTFDPTENKAMPEGLKPMPSLEIKVGDWLISRANITRLVGACALVDKTPPHLLLCDKIFRAVWRSDSPALPAYLDAVLKLPHLRRQIEAALTGTSPTMKNISKPALLALRLPLPPLGIQKFLVQAIAQARTEAAQLRQQAAQVREQARQRMERALLGAPSDENS